MCFTGALLFDILLTAATENRYIFEAKTGLKKVSRYGKNVDITPFLVTASNRCNKWGGYYTKLEKPCDTRDYKLFYFSLTSS